MSFFISKIIRNKKIKEKNIKKEYELLKFLTENNMELVWEFDSESGEGICIFNDGVYKTQKINNIYNYYLKHIHPEDIKKVEKELKDVIDGIKENYRVEFRRKKKDGSYEWVRSKGRAVLKSSVDNRKVIRGSEKRITDTKVAEENYKITESNFKSVLENIDYGIWAIDIDYKLIFLNSYSFKRYEEITGIKAKVGIDVDRLSKPENREFFRMHYKKALEGKKVSYDIEYIENNIKKTLTISLNPIIRDGVIVGASALARDVTYEREKEKELIKSKKILLEKNSDKDKFISIIAHDLKGPIGTMIPIIKLLHEEAGKSENKVLSDMAGYLSKISQTTYKLLEDLLYWAKFQRGEIKFTAEKIEVHKIVEEIIEMFEIIAENKGVKIYDEIDDFFQIDADIQMTKAVIRNIVSNAIKFTPKSGKITIRVYTKNEKNIIEVEDSGVGISSDRIEKLFKISEIYSTKGTEGEKGTGLGLVICREFMEKQGGKIEIDSKIGIGTKIKLIFTL
jgi:PAS domain S-box-containing protein